MFVSFVHFLAMLLIAGFVIRYAQIHLVPRDSAIGKALAFIY